MKTKAETVQYLCDHVFGNYTLETQNSDEKDFHNVAVWTIKEGIEKAYDFGVEAVNNHDRLTAENERLRENLKNVIEIVDSLRHTPGLKKMLSIREKGFRVELARAALEGAR